MSIDIHVHCLDIGNFGIGAPVLIGGGDVKRRKAPGVVADFGEGVSAVSHEMVNSVVKRVIMRVP